MRRLISSLLLLACITLLSGCGLLLGGGSRQTVGVQTSPEATKLTTAPPTGDYTTPTSLNLERKTSYILTFSKEGYSPATFQLQSHVRGGIVVADVLLTGLIGVVVDAATGGWSKLSPESATVTLTKTAMIDGPDTINVGITVERGKAGTRLDIHSNAPGVGLEVTPVDRH